MQNQPHIFKLNKWKLLLFLLIGLLFVAAGFFILEEEPLIGSLGIAFFGLITIVFSLQLLTNTAYLKLDEEGFEVKSLFRTHLTKWSEVKGFRQGSLHGNKMIFYDYTEEHKKWKEGKKLAKFLSGSHGALQSNYNIKTAELLKLMKEVV